MNDERWHSGISRSYWITSGLVLVVGGVFIAVAINIAGLILAAMGLGAFWLASRSRSW